ncbi:MAG: (Fe-S)-binding protein [Halioglobus sp.]|jgi:L-lactate dehydrogenase complex protein LldE|uniref:(Fe-S)-binding protein n=1 Tax=Candidatus Seongchinamella marina TaxID=2518990 RepID=A0ABT3SRP8_9GAMM|nr:(Fe-S)-binding protein [Candidatus Seongchinamella marina]EEB78627.1 Cysteine-rich domain protein [marine gamma proteobacterium HTCC2148]MBT3410852.1 (Fe-S)-binding protein [Halieaceae bacterium]MDG1388647.1 (Fe-S)-binding protein [Halioglobus sp.]MBT6126100.1 (Fe-S)-binding protein [Halieaceae bacterium]MBT7719438.1 (Fe-S)-binding protein [Halieaceae bacterium]
MSDPSPPSVSLFVTCLADLIRPSVAFASIRLLEQAGCIVDVPVQQTCCGQPGYNSGDYESTVPIAKKTIALFEHAQFVVAPSGSCAGMLTEHYPKLLEGEWQERAIALAEKTYELTSFLADVVKLDKAPAILTQMPTVTYHDSCAGLRELGIKEQPRKLLRELCEVDIKEMQQADVCCGFGGTFCAKMPDISGKMVDDKLRDAVATGAGMITGGDLGCLLNIAGRARREGIDIEVRHVAELLSGDLYSPAIGEGE